MGKSPAKTNGAVCAIWPGDSSKNDGDFDKMEIRWVTGTDFTAFETDGSATNPKYDKTKGTLLTKANYGV